MSQDSINTPAHHQTLIELGYNYYLKQQIEAAQIAFQQALKAVPDSAEAWHGLSLIHKSLGELQAGKLAAQKALEFQPNSSSTHNTLGTIFQALDDLDQATIHYQKALALNPRIAKTWNNLGNLALKQNKIDQALQYYQEALQINPKLFAVHANIARVFHHQGKIEAALEWAKQSIQVFQTLPKEEVDNSEAQKVFSQYMFYLFASPDVRPHEVLQQLSRWSELFQFKKMPLELRPRQPERSLRIGYVSSDFRQHSAVGVFEQLFAHHNSSHFQIYAYANINQADPVSERLKSSVAHWRTITHLSDEQVFQQIQKDKIDILVDLNGHTAGNRLSLFALKPAPIQVTGLGFGWATGVPEIDYQLTDPQTQPSIFSQFMPAKLVYLKSQLHWQAPSHSIAIAQVLPLQQNGYLTLGCANNLFKLNPLVLTVWKELMEKIPKLRLHLKAPQFDEEAPRHTLEEFFGSCSKRLHFTGSTNQHDHLLFWQNIDIALDPFPYNGGITTCEALWMGVPVISLKQGWWCVGASILHHLSLTELLAETTGEYIQKVQTLSEEPLKLLEWRKTLRKLILESELCQATSFTRQVEAAYRMMWRKYCKL